MLCTLLYPLQAVNVPFNTRLYTDLVSVEVPSGMGDNHTLQPAPCYKSSKITEEGPNISDLYPLMKCDHYTNLVMYSNLALKSFLCAVTGGPPGPSVANFVAMDGSLDQQLP